MGSETHPPTVVPLPPAHTAGHKGHPVVVRAPRFHPARQEECPAGQLAHPAVRGLTAPEPQLLRGGPLGGLGELALAHGPHRVLPPQAPQVRAGHPLGGHVGRLSGLQGALQEAPAEVGLRPEVGCPAPHAGFVFQQAGPTEHDVPGECRAVKRSWRHLARTPGRWPDVQGSSGVGVGWVFSGGGW